MFRVCSKRDLCYAHHDCITMLLLLLIPSKQPYFKSQPNLVGFTNLVVNIQAIPIAYEHHIDTPLFVESCDLRIESLNHTFLNNHGQNFWFQ